MFGNSFVAAGSVFADYKALYNITIQNNNNKGNEQFLTSMIMQETIARPCFVSHRLIRIRLK